jgi:putative ABC transport system ATP-binding protein
LLELRQLVKHYPVGDGPAIRAVDGVSLTVQRGEFVALYGPSGSGKTTLLHLIAGLLRPDSGQVLLDGRDTASLSKRERDEWRLRQLGVVGQPHHLIPGARAVESASLKLWLAGQRRSRAAVELLEQLGLGERLKHRTEQLSMGERQRVMIAQALVLDPKLVLADEPTGLLDTRRTREVLELLRDLCRARKAAVVLVTHDVMATGIADRVFELRDGQLVEADAAEHLLRVREELSG